MTNDSDICLVNRRRTSKELDWIIGSFIHLSVAFAVISTLKVLSFKGENLSKLLNCNAKPIICNSQLVSSVSSLERTVISALKLHYWLWVEELDGAVDCFETLSHRVGSLMLFR